MRDIDPDSEENQFQTRQNEREVFALQMQAKADAEPELEMCPYCGGQGWYAVYNRFNGDAEQQQCQWCAEHAAPDQKMPLPDRCQCGAPLRSNGACALVCAETWGGDHKPAPEQPSPAVAALCRVGVSIYIKHNIGMDGACTRCGARLGVGL